MLLFCLTSRLQGACMCNACQTSLQLPVYATETIRYNHVRFTQQGLVCTRTTAVSKLDAPSCLPAAGC